MSSPPRPRGFAELFRRERRPGDLVFATLCLAGSAFLLSRLGTQTVWVPGTKLFAQPAFWPAVSLGGMTLCAIGHWLGSVSSPRLPGRWTEVALWGRSLEYAAWFLAYAFAVPRLGYLPSTVAFAVLLVFRSGYRSGRALGAAALAGVAIVVTFKTLLQVRVPGGALYERLPGGLRSFMLTYF